MHIQVEPGHFTMQAQFFMLFIYMFLIFSGEVLVYDLVHVEEVVPMATGECGGGSVTTLLWIDSAISRVSATRSSSTLVATTSTGYILEWTLNITKQELQLKSG